MGDSLLALAKSIYYFQANKTHFGKKGFPRDFKVKSRSQEWPRRNFLLRTIPVRAKEEPCDKKTFQYSLSMQAYSPVNHTSLAKKMK